MQLVLIILWLIWEDTWGERKQDQNKQQSWLDFKNDYFRDACLSIYR